MIYVVPALGVLGLVVVTVLLLVERRARRETARRAERWSEAPRRPDVDRLEVAVTEAVWALIDVIGEPDVGIEPEVPFDADAVAVPALRAVRSALDMLEIALTLLDPATPSMVSVEEGLGLLERRRGGGPV